MAKPSPRGMLSETLSLHDWLQWQVFVCALIIILPAVVSIWLIIKRKIDDESTVKSHDLWVPCWRNMSPIWLLLFRAFAFVFMASLLYLTVDNLGHFVFFFYTQWTFALVGVYFALGTFISARGCLLYTKNPLPYSGSGDGERVKLLETTAEVNSENEEVKSSSFNSQMQRLGFLEKLLLIVYQICAGAVMLTDIVFWGLLLPFMAGETFKLTLLIGCMHSVNAIFLLLDSILNNLQFTWFGLTYFVLWSCCYVAFQWTLHMFGLSWWPYPFMQLKTPWAPLWYLGLAIVHLPCYGIYDLLMKAKDKVFSRMFPQAFLRSSY